MGDRDRGGIIRDVCEVSDIPPPACKRSRGARGQTGAKRLAVGACLPLSGFVVIAKLAYRTVRIC